MLSKKTLKARLNTAEAMSRNDNSALKSFATANKMLEKALAASRKDYKELGEAWNDTLKRVIELEADNLTLKCRITGTEAQKTLETLQAEGKDINVATKGIFNWENFCKGEYAVHCKTEDEAKDFYNHGKGKKCFGTCMVESWKALKSQTCYLGSKYNSFDTFKKYGVPVVEWADYMGENAERKKDYYSARHGQGRWIDAAFLKNAVLTDLRTLDTLKKEYEEGPGVDALRYTLESFPMKGKGINAPTKIYISGPITGNLCAESRFSEAETRLKELGYETVNPYRLGEIMPESATQGDYMRVCLALLDCCGGIVMLKNWEYSKGAKKERNYALDNGLQIYDYSQFDLAEKPTTEESSEAQKTLDALQKGNVFRHFKGGIYTVVDVARNTQTDSQMVIYKGDRGQTFARPYDEFISKVDKEKYPLCPQTYRFKFVGMSKNKEV